MVIPAAVATLTAASTIAATPPSAFGAPGKHAVSIVAIYYNGESHPPTRLSTR